MIRSVRKRSGLLIFLCCAVYFTSYLTRHNYAAALVEIVRDMGIDKETGSCALTGMFVTYGAGQLFSGWLGDRFSPRTVIAVGIFATSLCNFGMVFLSDIIGMTVLWCINGFAQAMLWPPLVRIMTENLDDGNYRKASLLVSIAASVGSIAVYLLVPACIAASGWRSAFLVPALIGVCVAFVWIFSEKRCESPTKIQKNDDAARGADGHWVRHIIHATGLVPIILGIVLQGMLRDGITTWMPAYIADNYSFGTDMSVLTTVVLPIFGIVSISAASLLQKKVGSDLTASTLLFGLACLSGVILRLLGQTGAAVSVVCMMLITGCMHGVNMLLISRLPAYFSGYGKVSTISGVLNTFTYVGSALSSYGFAAISERRGWEFTTGIWALIALFGTVCCGSVIGRWNRFAKRKSESVR